MSGIRIFELLEELIADSSARARLLRWSGREYSSASLLTVTVHDFVGEHGVRGDRGYCFFSEDSQRWEVLGTLARGCLGTGADANLATIENHERKDEREGRQGATDHTLFPAMGEGSHDDWPTSALM
ncbi:MAG TPA: hypothetical protein VGN12_07360 [Pirellulales bacterium]|jgi:hypothetical protein